MAHHDLVQGDGGSILTVTLLDSLSGQPLDLTNKTVQLRYSINGATTVEKSMTLLNQGNFPGQATYQFLAADLSVSGLLTGEVRIQDGLTDQLTTVDEFRLAIKAPLP